jgi:hypothetical protein
MAGCCPIRVERERELPGVGILPAGPDRRVERCRHRTAIAIGALYVEYRWSAIRR